MSIFYLKYYYMTILLQEGLSISYTDLVLSLYKVIDTETSVTIHNF